MVAAVTSGPTAGAVPKAGGVPAAGVGAGGGVCASACTPVTSAAAEAAVVVRNSRRDLGMVILSVRRRGERGKPIAPSTPLPPRSEEQRPAFTRSRDGG